MLNLEVSHQHPERADNIESANKRKYNRYSPLAADIEESGHKCKNIPFEVGSRGHLTLENKSKLTIINKLCRPKTPFRTFVQNILKNTLLCSYSIYLSKKDNWNNNVLLSQLKK
jgi:hypothetical protein